jgi:quercetin dioxygenase-like cupin family protein
MAAVVLTFLTVGLSNAQPPASPIKRTPLQNFDVPGTNYETVIALAEVEANATVARHTHPGPESGYVLEGNLTLMVEGKPPLALKAGDSYQVPPVAIHEARSGDKGAKLIVTYVVEKGKPLASPAN